MSARTRYLRRRATDAAAKAFALLATVFGIGWLVWILAMLVRLGAPGLGASLLTETTPPPGEDGGLSNAIVGSLAMTALGTLLGTPLGILAGTFLAESPRESRLAATVRFVNDILLSAPSILVGVFVYELVVVPTRTFSGWAGGLALAVLVVSIVTRTTESALRLVPVGLREAGAALGATRWRVSTQIVWRAARSGLLTGTLLAVARISGETAPLLFTALNNQFWSLDLAQPMANLPVVVFQYAMSPYDDWQRLAWAGSLLVAGAVLLLNVVARAMAGGTGRRSR